MWSIPAIFVAGGVLLVIGAIFLGDDIFPPDVPSDTPIDFSELEDSIRTFAMKLADMSPSTRLRKVVVDKSIPDRTRSFELLTIGEMLDAASVPTMSGPHRDDKPLTLSGRVRWLLEEHERMATEFVGIDEELIATGLVGPRIQMEGPGDLAQLDERTTLDWVRTVTAALKGPTKTTEPS